MTDPGRALWAEVDLDAIAANYHAVRGLVCPDVAIWAALKGNAYGMGIAPVGDRLHREGVRAFAVGDIADACVLRAAGLRQPVLLFPNCLPDTAGLIVAHGFTLTLCSLAEALAWQAALTAPIDVMIKVDVGDGRASVLPREAGPLAACVAAAGCFRLTGLMAHLHLPDPSAMRGSAMQQLDNFCLSEQAVEAQGLNPPTRMISGTAGLLARPELDLNAIDPGRVLYGIGFPGTNRRPALRPALHALRERLLLVKQVDAAGLGGVAPPFPIDRPRRVGLAPVGFANRFPRPAEPGTAMLLRRRRAPVLGPIHSEHLRLDLDGIPDAAYGDVVTLIGHDGDAEIAVDDTAAMWGTDTLGLYAALGRHLPRHYIEEGHSHA